MFERFTKKEVRGTLDKVTAKNQILQLVQELKDWYSENERIVFSPYGLYSFDSKIKKVEQILAQVELTNKATVQKDILDILKRVEDEIYNPRVKTPDFEEAKKQIESLLK